jgi:RNAse (barnase) inhibitor barstar
MSDSADLHKQLKAALAAYRKATENADSFEAKLRDAKKAEADALTDDGGDEKKIVKAVAESQGLQAVYSRRLELARQKVPEAFATIQPLVKALAQDLARRCYTLAAERTARHREVFRARLDVESFHRQFTSSLRSFPIDYETDLDQLADCCPDVINSKACVPLLVWTNNPVVGDKWGLTIERIEEDIARLKDAETAYEAEAAKEYDFTPAPREEKSTDREPELAEQSA